MDKRQRKINATRLILIMLSCAFIITGLLNIQPLPNWVSLMCIGNGLVILAYSIDPEVILGRFEENLKGTDSTLKKSEPIKTIAKMLLLFIAVILFITGGMFGK